MTHRHYWPTPRPTNFVKKWRKGSQLASTLVCGLSMAFGIGSALPVQAAPPETAPAELVNTLTQIEAAATAGNVDAVMQSYSPDFTNDDGFTYETLPSALETLWARYDDLTYRVELKSWERAGGGYTAETVTYIDGTKIINGQPTALASVIRSEQAFVGGKVVSQKTLSERNQMTSGEMPPTVSVILPEQVDAGESYDFDAIVMEPLGNRYLLGAAVEEGVTSADFFTGRPVELELLAAGGLFKIGEAPTAADNRWVSALLVREDGLTVVTRRLRVN